VQHMKNLIRQGAKDFYVRQKAVDILLEKGVSPKDYLGEIKALFEWVQRHVRYTKDPFRVEVLHSAPRMLELRAGDCDDMAILLGSMLRAIGHPVRLVLTGPDPLRPRFLTHVYIQAYHKDRWVSADPTMHHPLGWAPRAPVREVIEIEERGGLPPGPSGLNGMDGEVLVVGGPGPRSVGRQRPGRDHELVLRRQHLNSAPPASRRCPCNSSLGGQVRPSNQGPLPPSFRLPVMVSPTRRVAPRRATHVAIRRIVTQPAQFTLGQPISPIAVGRTAGR
jgi:hypothetical protein